MIRAELGDQPQLDCLLGITGFISHLPFSFFHFSILSSFTSCFLHLINHPTHYKQKHTLKKSSELGRPSPVLRVFGSQVSRAEVWDLHPGLWLSVSELHHCLSWGSRLQTTHHGTSQLCNCGGQFLIRNLFICIYYLSIHQSTPARQLPLLVLRLWRTLAHTDAVLRVEVRCRRSSLKCTWSGGMLRSGNRSARLGAETWPDVSSG